MWHDLERERTRNENQISMGSLNGRYVKKREIKKVCVRTMKSCNDNVN